MVVYKFGSFQFVPPSLVGAYYLHPPNARAIYLHNDLPCNDTCSVTGGSITYWGGGAQTKKIHNFFHFHQLLNWLYLLLLYYVKLLDYMVFFYSLKDEKYDKKYVLELFETRETIEKKIGRKNISEIGRQNWVTQTNIFTHYGGIKKFARENFFEEVKIKKKYFRGNSI